MFMKTGKKKTHIMLALGVGAAAVYGAYSAVCGVKNMCVNKMKMLTKVVKKNDKASKSDNTVCEECCE